MTTTGLFTICQGCGEPLFGERTYVLNPDAFDGPCGAVS